MGILRLCKIIHENFMAHSSYPNLMFLSPFSFPTRMYFNACQVVGWSAEPSPFTPPDPFPSILHPLLAWESDFYGLSQLICLLFGFVLDSTNIHHPRGPWGWSRMTHSHPQLHVWTLYGYYPGILLEHIWHPIAAPFPWSCRPRDDVDTSLTSFGVLYYPLMVPLHLAISWSPHSYQNPKRYG